MLSCEKSWWYMKPVTLFWHVYCILNEWFSKLLLLPSFFNIWLQFCCFFSICFHFVFAVVLVSFSVFNGVFWVVGYYKHRRKLHRRLTKLIEIEGIWKWKILSFSLYLNRRFVFLSWFKVLFFLNGLSYAERHRGSSGTVSLLFLQIKDTLSTVNFCDWISEQ